MKLYYTLTSPYVRIIRIALIECGLMDGVELVLARNRQPDNPTLEVSPIGRVPTLVDGERVVVETRHILGYLDALTGIDRFFPKLRQGDWTYLTIEGMASGWLDGLSVWGRESMRPEDKRWMFWTDVEAERTSRCIPWFDSHVNQLDPGSLCFAALLLGCNLQIVDHLAPELDWRAQAPHLAAWHAAQIDRDSYRQTAPDTVC